MAVWLSLSLPISSSLSSLPLFLPLSPPSPLPLPLPPSPQDPESRSAMVGYLRTISVSSTKLLLAAKALSADPNAPNVMNQLAAACRAVTDAINSLLDLCSTSGPGQKECDNALRNIEVHTNESSHMTVT